MESKLIYNRKSLFNALNNANFIRHKDFFTLVFSLLIIVFVFLIYSFVQQQKVYQSKAAEISTPSSEIINTVSKPNFIVIMTDDMRYDDLQYMDSVKKLIADQGTNFVNAIAPMTLCCPSRISFLTGKCGHNHNILRNRYKNDGGFRKFYETGTEAQDVFVLDLKNAGYKTILLGKYLNEYPDLDVVPQNYIPPGWTNWQAFLYEYPYTSYFNYRMNVNGTIVSYGQDVKDYSTDVLTKKTITAINNSVKNQKPFFIFLNYTAPHAPAIPASRHQNTQVNITYLPSYNESDLTDKPSFMQEIPTMSERLNYVEDEENSDGYKSSQNVLSLIQSRARSLYSVDEGIATIINYLNINNLSNNTYLIFTSDQGLMLGEHRIVNMKQMPYEESIKIPLYIVGPNILNQKIKKPAVSLIDLAPTILDLAGVRTTLNFDGLSLKNVLTGNIPISEFPRQFVIAERPYLYMDGYFFSSTNPNPSWNLLRGSRYSYIEYKNGEVELYDIVNDPYELNNLAKSQEENIKKILNNFKTELNYLITCVGQECLGSKNITPTRVN